MDSLQRLSKRFSNHSLSISDLPRLQDQGFLPLERVIDFEVFGMFLLTALLNPFGFSLPTLDPLGLIMDALGILLSTSSRLLGPLARSLLAHCSLFLSQRLS